MANNFRGYFFAAPCTCWLSIIIACCVNYWCFHFYKHINISYLFMCCAVFWNFYHKLFFVIITCYCFIVYLFTWFNLRVRAEVIKCVCVCGLQPFVDELHPLQSLFLPRLYALLIPIAAGVIAMIGLGTGAQYSYGLSLQIHIVGAVRDLVLSNYHLLEAGWIMALSPLWQFAPWLFCTLDDFPSGLFTTWLEQAREWISQAQGAMNHPGGELEQGQKSQIPAGYATID